MEPSTLAPGRGEMSDEIRGTGEGKDGAALTAYPEEEAELRRRLDGGRVDAGSFRRRVARCEISACRGMCCHDGVYLGRESAAAVERVAREHAEFFADLGLRLPDRLIVEGDWPWKRGGLKTAVRPRPFSGMIGGYPAHFPDTACVLLAQDGRCSLQLLSMRLDRHPWYFKPIKCWMHPITLEGEARATLLLHDEQSDPYRFPGYDGFVSRIFCGRSRADGRPASSVLAEELAFLSRIVGRNLLAEAQATPAPSGGPGPDSSRRIRE